MKINRKTVLSTAAVLGVAALIAGGTIAYFTDNDREDNVFTFGNVKVALNEQQREVDSDGCKVATLTDFTDGKAFYPIVGSASGGAKDASGMPADCDSTKVFNTNKSLAKNYVDKMVSVTNTGTSPAYIRVYYGIPRALLDSNLDDDNENDNAIHFNEGTFVYSDGSGFFWSGVYPHDGTVTSETAKGATWLLGPVENDVVTGKYHYITTIDGTQYAVYYQDIIDPLAGGETSDRVLNGFYLDASATVQEVQTATGTEEHIFNKGVDTGWKVTDPVTIPVATVAVQSEGFGSTDQAVTAAFGANFDPFNN